jgi:hypothetical protein
MGNIVSRLTIGREGKALTFSSADRCSLTCRAQLLVNDRCNKQFLKKMREQDDIPNIFADLSSPLRINYRCCRVERDCERMSSPIEKANGHPAS